MQEAPKELLEAVEKYNDSYYVRWLRCFAVLAKADKWPVSATGDAQLADACKRWYRSRQRAKTENKPMLYAAQLERVACVRIEMLAAIALYNEKHNDKYGVMPTDDSTADPWDDDLRLD